MRISTTALVIAAAAMLCLINSVVQAAKPYTEQLVFFDDFQRLDTAIWKHAITLGGGGNWEFQQYVNNRSISWVDNGVLYLKPMPTEDYLGSSVSAEGAAIDLWGNEMPDLCTGNFQYGCYRTAFSGHILNPVTSARVRTAESFSFKYGRVEVKARLPVGDWLWPAIWMMPRWNRYGTWPASGEIDIMESRGNKVYTQYNKEGGADTFASTTHWGPYFGANGYELTHTVYTLPNGKLMHDDYHIFGLYWDQERLYTYFDDPKNVVLDIDLTEGFWTKAKKAGLNWENNKLFNPWATAPARAPFNQEFFLILQNAVGAQNGYFADNIPGKPWKNSSPSCFKEFWDGKSQWLPTWKGNDSALQIDYVKVWIFPEISTYTFNNQTSTPGVATSIALPLWVYLVAIIGGLLSIAGAALGGLSFAMLLAKRVRKERFGKEKRAAAIRRDQPMAAGSEIALEEETRRTAIAH